MALTAERIVEASLAILDEYGLADMTMRRVAEALGVKAGALYWHFPNKQTLLAAVADQVLDGLETLSRPDGNWLGEWAAAVRFLLLAHRDAAELVASTRAMGLGRVDPAAQAREVLVARGATEDEAEGVAQAFMHFVLGHVMEEQTQSQLAALGVIGGFDGERSQRHFDWGVRLLVAGSERGVAQTAARLE
ncbi:TetR family transcriptional regulator [Tessaracoccus antarcticus]|uniref:TetR family transcriptional regulator n=1 Tax=Tessaracoccus antarcticus TaxID=2479848 RepID=A0A3M0G642_9ACTN|nr:TetR family transcriptional regulator [Tessaracoccus antarcticus]RMB57742.1 TetR family transcriptional regulator [Tessaracoccus antarcticus]